ncbi:ribosome-inactivating protein cucurmosin-like [Euphorbia lathyris]|uniref:ribosome-inactivating protein cucurmosin-like n=1 Tax=Euphorbia lathyris TaxID=212925 RepID=UPI003313DBC8
MEGNMNVWMVAMAAWLCWSSVAIESTRICSDHQTTPDNQYPNHLTFFVDDPTAETYSKFLKNLRVKLTCETLDQHQLPVLCTKAQAQGQLYATVVLTYNGVPLTLALDVVNLNLVAYKSGTKSYFFANTEDLQDQLFQETEQVVMKYSNSYKSLDSREAVNLGMSALRTAVVALSNYDESKIKTSLITVIGMVSEAARLKVIENAVTSAFTTDVKPSSKIISYEDKWEELSKNIQRATRGKFPSAVTLKDEHDVSIRVTSVGQVQGNMGILKHYNVIEGYAVA